MIKVESLKKTYDKGTRRAHEVLHGISFTLPDTGFVCILGASGCGKTSLLNAIGGLDVFDSGTITTETAEIKRSRSLAMERERNAKFGYIFQNYYLLAEHSVAYNVYLGLHSLDLSKKEKFKRVSEALERVDMLRYRKRPVGELSGGQQQRVAIARALARKPRVIFADEPTGNLDQANTMNICTILKELSRESLVVMVTHEVRIANFFADRIITIDEGRIISDSTEWERGTLDAGEKDTVYSGDYGEESIQSENLSVRMLLSADAPPVSITLVAERDRIIVKVSDPRVTVCSDFSSAPYVAEGKRPVLTDKSFEEKPISKREEPAEEKSGKKWFDIGMIFAEARRLVSGRKLREFGTGLFIILLTLMISLTMADIITVYSSDPADFIKTDSHTLEVKFRRGDDLQLSAKSLDPYIAAYVNYINQSGQDIDIIPLKSTTFRYKDNTLHQLGSLSMNFPVYSLVDIDRFDETNLIMGRMPERYDEIVVDRWVLEVAMSKDGILQNMIPDYDFFLGKTLLCDRKYSPTIVGISDSGEPSIYMNKLAMISIGIGGYEVTTVSEYLARGGDLGETTVGINECILFPYNAGLSYGIGQVIETKSGMPFVICDKIFDTPEGVEARILIADEAVDELYYSVIAGSESLVIWAEDKVAFVEYLNQPLPEELAGKLNVEISDSYQIAYDEFYSQRSAKLDAKTVVTVSVLALCAIMLYLMQRSKIKERMDLITVYRLLGIPKRNLMLVFSLESVITTAKYSLITVLLAWGAINIISMIEILETVFVFPLWGALITFGIIAVYRLIIAVMPILTLNRKPPARLAAEYDF